MQFLASFMMIEIVFLIDEFEISTILTLYLFSFVETPRKFIIATINY